MNARGLRAATGGPSSPAARSASSRSGAACPPALPSRFCEVGRVRQQLEERASARSPPAPCPPRARRRAARTRAAAPPRGRAAPAARTGCRREHVEARLGMPAEVLQRDDERERRDRPRRPAGARRGRTPAAPTAATPTRSTAATPARRRRRARTRTRARQQRARPADAPARAPAGTSRTRRTHSFSAADQPQRPPERQHVAPATRTARRSPTACSRRTAARPRCAGSTAGRPGSGARA